VILDKIMAHKRVELEDRKQKEPLSELETRAKGRARPLSLSSMLRRQGVKLIAEIKKASPSKGMFRPELNPVEVAGVYAANGASAISVLTDQEFFRGSLGDLAAVKTMITGRPKPIPILRKDFIFDPYQVVETYAVGADALLLIVAVVPDPLLAELYSQARDLGMEALLEVHDEQELERALRLKPTIVGVNNRNLLDFTVDLNTFGKLRPLIPEHIVSVSESGVHTGSDVHRLAEMGADAVLVGEALVTARDISAQVRDLVRAGRFQAVRQNLETTVPGQ
jgi:indole-3-glycerol phosphate synthase